MEFLRTGVAYHGNRILKHVDADMADICRHGMNTVVHMFSHNDWDRHLGVMKDIVRITEDYGLEVWIDNWGIGGPPGDKSHFLQYHPEAHQIFSDGTPDPVSACYNSEAFVRFTKDWLYTVREFGGKKIFWDEPHFKYRESDGKRISTCHCPTCQRLFAEAYGKQMPQELTPEVKAFQMQTMQNYFHRVTEYSDSLGMKNAVCVMLHTLQYTTELVKLPYVEDFGVDPYWSPRGNGEKLDPYNFVYDHSVTALQKAEECGKEASIWIQGFDIPAGHEDEIVMAADAAYDAGARSIFTWSYRGGESNSYRADNCERLWQVIGEAMNRVRNRHFDAIRAEKLAKYQN